MTQLLKGKCKIQHYDENESIDFFTMHIIHILILQKKTLHCGFGKTLC